MEINKENIKTLENMLMEYAETKNYSRAQDLAGEILSVFPENDVAYFYNSYLNVKTRTKTVLTTITPFRNAFNHVIDLMTEKAESGEKTNLLNKMQRYFLDIGSLIWDICHEKILIQRPAIFFHDEMYSFIDFYVDCITQPNFLEIETAKELCKKLLSSLNAIIFSMTNLNKWSYDEDGVIKIIENWYTHGELEEKLNNFLKGEKKLSHEELEKKYSTEVLEYKEEIDTLKAEFDKIMETANIFIKNSSKVKDLARKISNLIGTQRMLAKEYASSLRKPRYSDTEHFQQCHWNLTQKTFMKERDLWNERINEFCDKYKINNYFYHFYCVNYEKFKHIDKTPYKTYNPNGVAKY